LEAWYRSSFVVDLLQKCNSPWSYRRRGIDLIDRLYAYICYI